MIDRTYGRPSPRFRGLDTWLLSRGPEWPLGYSENRGALAQLGERRLCKPEVTGSIPVRSIGRKAASGARLRR
jgi:hypothetical protein